MTFPSPYSQPCMNVFGNGNKGCMVNNAIVGKLDWGVAISQQIVKWLAKNQWLKG